MFISFEGVGGAGKTTQAARASDFLCKCGVKSVLTREPGGTTLGEHLRSLILGQDELRPSAEALLFAAARAELVAEVIAPTLARGDSVVCDRFIDSSLAYQGIVRGLGIETVLDINETATQGLLPNKTFLLHVDIVEAARRRKAIDRIEGAQLEIKRALSNAYLELASRFQSRIVGVDANRPAEEIAEEVREHVRALL